MFAVAYSWTASFHVTYAIEFLCLSAAELMVLDRMKDFAAAQGPGMRNRWVLGGRIVMAAVVLGNAVGLAANAAAAVHFQKAAEAASAASSYFASNNTQDGNTYRKFSGTEAQIAFSIASVQSFCEVVVLLLIVLAFALVSIACIRRVASALHALNSMPIAATDPNLHQQLHGRAIGLGRQMQRKIVVTTGFVFVAFVLRSVVSTMLAVAYQLQNSGNTCSPTSNSNPCDASCTNMYTHIAWWNNYTPEFLPTVVLISSPLALLVALWGMTSKDLLLLMKSSLQAKSHSMTIVESANINPKHNEAA